jgi:AbrB family looped-hinge helix DNA binding protein
MVSRVTVSPKFQISIPKEVREAFGIKAGDSLSWYDDGGGLTLVRTIPMSEWDGYLEGRGPFLPFERDKSDAAQSTGAE